MKTIDYWKGKGGNEYTKRNRVDWQARIPFWKMILDKTGARSVFEFGCNAGWNLSAIKRIYSDVSTHGYDVNVRSVQQARYAGLDAHGTERFARKADLSCTAGVLIHIPSEDLKQTMKTIISKSYDWVLAIEYYAEEETEIEYQGEMGLLWKRPYGKLYEEMGLEWVDGDYPAVGFDGCQWDLLRK